MTPIPLYPFEEPPDCDHEHTEPLYGYVHPTSPRPGDEIVHVNDRQPIGIYCTDCGSVRPIQ